MYISHGAKKKKKMGRLLKKMKDRCSKPVALRVRQ